MANTFKLKQSAVGGKVPTTAQLALGELAVNTRDGKVFTKKNVDGVESIVDITAGSSGPSGVRVQSIISDTVITPTSGTADEYIVTALAAAATVAAPSGTPTDGQRLILRIKDNGTTRALTWASAVGAYRAIGITLPISTTPSKVTYVGLIYNAQDSFWDAIATVTQV